MSYYFVGVYLEEFSFGGREEGGWWYNEGELVEDPEILQKVGVPKIFLDFNEAMQYHAEQQNVVNLLNVGRRPKSSVLSDGIYSAMFFEDDIVKHYSQTRPHYK